jgi:hypothetical protein
MCCVYIIFVPWESFIRRSKIAIRSKRSKCSTALLGSNRYGYAGSRVQGSRKSSVHVQVAQSLRYVQDVEEQA